MVTPKSYLQTLSTDEAIAFIASLQKVRDHLSQELHWVSEQALQKTAQLQGIETLLVEAKALGLVVDDRSTPVDALAAPVVSATSTIHESGLELPATSNGSLAASEVEPVTAAIAALPVETSKPLDGQTAKASRAKTSYGSKPSVATKSSTAKTKQAKPSTPTARNVKQRGKASNVQQFLKSQWRDQALTAAVGDILDRAATPLSTDEVMAALYDGLPTADYDRAKHSLANILSVGRSKGTWQSTSRGRYASNAVTP